MTDAFEIQGGSMTWLMNEDLYAGMGMSLAEMTLNVGMTSELHMHNSCDEVIFLRQGQIEQRVGKEWLTLSAGDKCHIPRSSAHQSRNIGTIPAKMILVYESGQRDYQKLD